MFFLGKKPPPLHIGIGMESLSDGTDFKDVASKFEEADVEGYSLAVGRVEWLAFPWENNEDIWSGVAEKAAESNTDPIKSAMEKLGPERYSTLTVDVLTPATNEDNPEYMGKFANGENAPEFPNAVALHDGETGTRLTALCAEISERYHPDRIALTELMGDTFFSENDEKLFSTMTGEDGFPRTEDNSIDTAHPVLQAWQAEIIGGVLQRCSDAANLPVEMDARVNWEDPGANRAESGHNYDQILKSQHHLTLWAYTGLSGSKPESTHDLVRGIRQRFNSKALDSTTISVGLWTNNDDAYSPTDTATAVKNSAGASSVLVTPLSMMTDKHWHALSELQ